MRQLLLISLLVSCLQVGKADGWFVADDGDNSNSGVDSTNALLTIQAAHDSCSAGDTIFVCVGSYSEAVDITTSGNSRADPNVLRYNTVANGCTIVTTSGSSLRFNEVSYWTVKGIRTEMSGTGATNNIYLYGTDGVTIDSCQIIGVGTSTNASSCQVYWRAKVHSDSVDDYAGNTIRDGIHTWAVFTNNYVDGKAVEGSWAYIDQIEDGVRFRDVDTFLVQGNEFYNIRHYSIEPYESQCGFIDNNRYHDLHGGYEPEKMCIRIVAQNNVSWLNHQHPSSTAGTYFQGPWDSTTIVRFNRIYHSDEGEENASGSFTGVSSYNSSHRSRNASVAHNTVLIDYEQDSTHRMVFGLVLDDAQGDWMDAGRIYNNIFEAIDWPSEQEKSPRAVYMRDVGKANAASFTHEFNGNHVYVEGDTDVVYYYYSPSVSYGLEEAKDALGSQWLSGNIGYEYSGLSTDTALTLDDTSQCIDAAVALTTTTNSGSSETDMTVGRSLWFTDGYGVIGGDTVWVDGMTPFEWGVVDAINYGTNTITFDDNRTWSSSADVGYWKNGALASNIGAVQPGAPAGGESKIYFRGYKK
jgi:hypothetical protein